MIVSDLVRLVTVDRSFHIHLLSIDLSFHIIIIDSDFQIYRFYISVFKRCRIIYISVAIFIDDHFCTSLFDAARRT